MAEPQTESRPDGRGRTRAPIGAGDHAEPDRADHESLAHAVDGRVEEGPERASDPAAPRKGAVQDVENGADDEEHSADPEEAPARVLEPDGDRARDAVGLLRLRVQRRHHIGGAQRRLRQPERRRRHVLGQRQRKQGAGQLLRHRRLGHNRPGQLPGRDPQQHAEQHRDEGGRAVARSKIGQAVPQKLLVGTTLDDPAPITIHAAMAPAM